ncbi:MAG: 16S rRNA (uracil(1498)-N(3))-methyltransferase [Candidatus Omnitrophica bacterium]|nr:16S rRNA (uracil(1498)-N(3))-methyltransferase [Candidatus Omnitrophota bacterium]
MSKVRVYFKEIDNKRNIVILDKDIVHKIKNVLRLSQEDKIYLFDGKGKEYCAIIDKITKSSIFLKDVKLERFQKEIKFKLFLGFPLLREEKIDFILQKATELGVSGFIPFFCKNSLSNIPSAEKIKRWERIIIEATRQSDRLLSPQLFEISSFDNILKINFGKKFVATKDGKKIDTYLKNSSAEEIFVIVGPEGDFDKEEYVFLEKNNFKKISLSQNILRVETAAIFAVGLFNYFLL